MPATLILTLIGAVVGGVASAMEEQKKRRLPALVGWSGDEATFNRVRAGVDAGELPADPALSELARDYAIYRLANIRHRRGALVVLPLAPLMYLTAGVLNVGTPMAVAWTTLAVGQLFITAPAYWTVRILRPRWQRVADRTGRLQSSR